MPPLARPARRPRKTRRCLTLRGSSISSHPAGSVGVSGAGRSVDRRVVRGLRIVGLWPGPGARWRAPAGPRPRPGCCGAGRALLAAGAAAGAAAGPRPRLRPPGHRRRHRGRRPARRRAATATPLRTRRPELLHDRATGAAAATPGVDLAEARLRAGDLVALGHDLALVDPDLHADAAVGRLRLGEAVVDVRAQRVQRDAALRVLLRRATSRCRPGGRRTGPSRPCAPERTAEASERFMARRNDTRFWSCSATDCAISFASSSGRLISLMLICTARPVIACMLLAQRVDLGARTCRSRCPAGPCRCRP